MILIMNLMRINILIIMHETTEQKSVKISIYAGQQVHVNKISDCIKMSVIMHNSKNLICL